MLVLNTENSQWFGAQSLPQLIGRDNKLQEIMEIITANQAAAQVIFLTGEGGLGKTRLLLSAIEAIAKLDEIAINHGLIDLYHLQNHTTHGLAYQIVEQFGSYHFSRFQTIWDEIQSKIAAGRAIGQDRNRLLQAFADEFAAFSAKQRTVVIALDTAERILYSPLDNQNNEVELAETWQWLQNLLEATTNLVLIVAGRPEIKSLCSKAIGSVGQTKVELERFTYEDTSDYFGAVATLFRDREQAAMADMIDAIPTDQRQMAYQQSGGLPILLSLAIELMTKEGKLPSARPKDIVAAFQEGGELGETIIALGRLPKGANPELLAQLLYISPSEAASRLEDVKKLSIVKLRPDDETVFLHDKMYELLREEVFVHEFPPETVGALRNIEDYYQEKLEAVVDALKQLFKPVLESQAKYFNPHELTELSTQRRRLLVEYLYYLLNDDPIKGFRHYYRYMREAILSGDTLLDRELHLTLLEFWRERVKHQDHYQGLEKRQLYGVSRLRPVARAFSEGDYNSAIDEAARIRTTLQSEPTHRVRTTRAVLDIWEAYSRATRGVEDDSSIAKTLLDRAVRILTNYLEELGFEQYSPVDDFSEELGEYKAAAKELRAWRAKAVLAFAHRVRGYLLRAQQRLFDAIEDYQKASRLWQDVNILVEDAATRNDLGRALGDANEWDSARDLIHEALHIRRDRLGLWSAVGLSINTLAVLCVAEDRHSDARVHAQNALAIFEALTFPRGIALAYAILAEATRRLAISDLEPPNRHHLLREAYDLAIQASSLFVDINEISRQVQPEIEAGCAYRDLLILVPEPHSGRLGQERLKRLSIEHFEKAIQLSQNTHNLYRLFDSYISLLTLAAGTEDRALYETTKIVLENAISSEYLIKPGGSGKPQDISQSELFPQIGKWYALQGHQQMKRHFAQFEQDWRREPTEALAQAMEYYTLSIEYHRTFEADRDFRELRKNTSEMHRYIEQLRATERRYIADILVEISTKYCLTESRFAKILRDRALIG